MRGRGSLVTGSGGSHRSWMMKKAFQRSFDATDSSLTATEG